MRRLVDGDDGLDSGGEILEPVAQRFEPAAQIGDLATLLDHDIVEIVDRARLMRCQYLKVLKSFLI